ncbi:hypothetical protein HDU97_010065 [Phlyctochytrium planicorne]|nr:hypothetical protein HDU97_010065 [Phlyctochytrium planicorne]
MSKEFTREGEPDGRAQSPCNDSLCAEVGKHNKPDDLWCVIDSYVFDLTDFADMHPGSAVVLWPIAGKDATGSQFFGLHRQEVLDKYFKKLCIGQIKGEKSKILVKTGDYSLVPYAESSFVQGKPSPFYNASHIAFRKAVRDFYEKELVKEAPLMDVMGERPTDEHYLKMGEFGLLACRLGPGDHLKGLKLPGGVKPEEVIGLPPVMKFGPKWMKEKIVPEVISGKKKICLAISEPGAGSDVSNIQCVATKSPCGKFFIVNGVKKWYGVTFFENNDSVRITNGTFCDYFSTAVRTGKAGMGGISMLLVERSEGLSTQVIKTSGTTSAGTAYVVYENVKVPVENLIGEENKGFAVIMGISKKYEAVTNFFFLPVPSKLQPRWSMVVGCARGARLVTEECFKWATQRKVFGKALIEQPVIRFKIGQMISEVEAVQAWVELITFQMNKYSYKEQNIHLAGPIALAKLKATRMTYLVSDNAVQIFGGRALTRTGMGRIIEQFQRTNKFGAILGGAEEVLADLGVRQAMKFFPNAQSSFFFREPEQIPDRKGAPTPDVRGVNASSEEDGLWSQILRGAITSHSVPIKNILILGDSGCGKTTILETIKNPAYSPGQLDSNASQLALTYSFFELLDEDAEDPTARIGMYELSSDDAFSPLIKFVINAETISNTMVLLCLDWNKPWRFFALLEKYLILLQQHIDTLAAENRAVVEEEKEKLENYIREFKDAGTGAQVSSSIPGIKSESLALSLGDGVLTHNLGIPIVVVCTKADATTMLERDLSYSEDRFDFIQQSLRTICLKYGAALFYVSTHRPATLSSLRSYLIHRLLWESGSRSHSYDEKAQVVDRENTRVPTGWDSWGMIRVQRDGFDCKTVAGLDDKSYDYTSQFVKGKSIFEEEVKVPDVDKSFSLATIIAAEDEQVFLERNMELLSAMSGALSGTASPLLASIAESIPARAPSGSTTLSSNDMLEDVSQKLARLAKLKEQTSATASRDKLPITANLASSPLAAGAPPGASQNEVLANFFQSLLTKKSTTGVPATGRSSSVSGSRAASMSMTLGGGGSQQNPGSPHGFLIFPIIFPIPFRAARNAISAASYAAVRSQLCMNNRRHNSTRALPYAEDQSSQFSRILQRASTLFGSGLSKPSRKVDRHESSLDEMKIVTWPEAVKKAETLVQSNDGPIISPRELLGSDLSLLTDNIRKLLGAGHPVLTTISNYYFQAKGKHIRPVLVLLISLATRGSSLPQAKPDINRALSSSSDIVFDTTPSLEKEVTNEDILPTQRRLAEITEMIHTASLLHDDVIDVAATRRSQSSANAEFGNKMAILAGDFLLARACVALSRLRNLEVVELLATVINDLVEGEFMQLRNSQLRQEGGVTLTPFEYYLKKTYMKTASLIAKSCRAAAVLGDSSSEVTEAVYEYGRNLGLAFQLVDDVLDFVSSSETFGKPVNADLQLGLATAPVLFAVEQFPELQPLIDRQFKNDGDVAKALDLVHRSDGVQLTRDLATSYCAEAVKAISILPPSPARQALIQLTHSVVNRQK